MIKLQKGTFCIIPVKILYGLPVYAQVIFMWLCHHSDKKGNCFPSISSLAKETGLCRRTIIKEIKRLEELKFIAKTIRKNDKKSNISNLYQLTFLEGGASAPDALGVVHHMHQGSAPDALGVVHTVHQHIYLTKSNITKSNITKKEIHKEKENRSAIPRGSRLAYGGNFNIFWNVYPLKKSKQDAWRSFEKLRVDESLLKKILEAIELQKQEMENKKQNGSFAPEWKYPATWLNGKCWEDEINLEMKNERKETAGARIFNDLNRRYKDAKDRGLI